MTVEVDQRPSGRSRYLYPAFIASLAINLLFIGWDLCRRLAPAK